MARLHRSLPYLLLLLLIGLGALLRFFQLGVKTVWLDEAFSIWLANHNWPDLWSWLIRIDQHPLFYYTLLSVWQFLFGDLQWTVRAFSALCSVLTLPVFFLAARRFFDQPTAFIALFILAIAPLHVQFAQEARMYALLILAVAVALYFLAQVLMNNAHTPRRRAWLGLAVAQAAVMLTHNTATVFFPLALNAGVGGALAWKYWQGGVSSWPALNDTNFERRWLRHQLLAVVLWLPWSVPFVIQAVMVDRQFWLAPPTAITVLQTLHNFNQAFLPDWFPLFPLWDALYWLLLVLGIVALRRTPARSALLLALFLLPIAGELLVSLRRPIFYERTLIWTTLPYYLLVAVGIRRLGAVNPAGWAWLRRPLQALVLVALVVLSTMSLISYYYFYEKEEWSKAANYIAENVTTSDAGNNAANSTVDDLILFNASWVQLPFDYYYRHYQLGAAMHGLPVDLFDRNELEPRMTTADLPALRLLVANRPHVWLVYSHEWYTDPEQLIPRELDRIMRRVDEQEFRGLRVIEYATK